MGKIADAAKSVAGIGLVAMADTKMGNLVRQAIQDMAELERWFIHLQALGVGSEDRERYLETVKRLAYTSAIFSNYAVIESGMELATRRASRDESIFPDNVFQWAIELWSLIIENNETEVRRTIWNLYGTIRLTSRDLCIDQWILDAERLWEKE